MAKKSKGNSISRVTGAFKSLDMFGESINFLIDGSSTMNSFAGAFYSLFIIVITLFFAVTQIQVMNAFADTSYMSTDENLDIDERGLNYNDTHFEVAFGLVPGSYAISESWSYEGYLELSARIITIESGAGPPLYEQLEIRPCTTNDLKNKF